MNWRDVIAGSSTIDEEPVLYAKTIDGQLLPTFEAVLLELTDEERERKTDEIANRKCPGFSYCMEMFLIKEMIQDV
jgi:hypothetical protein